MNTTIDSTSQLNPVTNPRGLPGLIPDQTTSRLRARPTIPALVIDTTAGLHRLPEVDDCWLYVPNNFNPEAPSPLLVVFHPENSTACGALTPLQDYADRAGCFLLAPQAQDRTWDALKGGYGVDLKRLDQALAWMFSHYHIKSSKLAVAGFSEGASYSLSVGLPNGDLFSHVIAFSPSFVVPFEIATGALAPGKPPRVFISHGTQDRVLAIDHCSRRIVRYLERTGLDVRYVEFQGGHSAPQAITKEAMAWFNGPVLSRFDF